RQSAGADLSQSALRRAVHSRPLGQRARGRPGAGVERVMKEQSEPKRLGGDAIRPWLRESHGPAFEAALEWLWPRCRTEEERFLAPALLLLLSPFNALVAPCRPAPGSCVNL